MEFQDVREIADDMVHEAKLGFFYNRRWFVIIQALCWTMPL